MGCFDRHIGNTFMAIEDVTNVQGALTPRRICELQGLNPHLAGRRAALADKVPKPNLRQWWFYPPPFPLAMPTIRVKLCDCDIDIGIKVSRSVNNEYIDYSSKVLGDLPFSSRSAASSTRCPLTAETCAFRLGADSVDSRSPAKSKRVNSTEAPIHGVDSVNYQ